MYYIYMGRLLMKGGGSIVKREMKDAPDLIVFYPDKNNIQKFERTGWGWDKDTRGVYFTIPDNSSILNLSPTITNGMALSVVVDDDNVLAAWNESNAGTTEQDELRQLLNMAEIEQNWKAKKWAEYIHQQADISDPIISEIAQLASQGIVAAASWVKAGIAATCRQQYINKFCAREKSTGSMSNIDERDLRLLLNYLPDVVYRCFGCRHDFYDNATAMRSYKDDLKLFLGGTGLNEQGLYSLFSSLLGAANWNKFQIVLYGGTCTTKTLEVAWEDLQSSIYDWINARPGWGLLWQDVPITMSLPRLSGEGANERKNIELTKARLNALDPTLIPRLVGVFDINKEPMKSLCQMLINMGGVGEIDGASVRHTERVVASVNPRLPVPCGAFASGTGTDVEPMYFYCPTAVEKQQIVEQLSGRMSDEESALVLSHKIFIFRGGNPSDLSTFNADNLLATCPTRIGVNQINANTVDVGGNVSTSSWRNKATYETANSCNIWFNIVLVTAPEKKQEIMQAAKATGDFFCKYISERIQQEGTIGGAITKGVLLKVIVTDEQETMARIVCINQTGDGLCDKECTSSGLASCFAFGTRIEISVPAYLCGGGDIKPILIKEFALKLGDFQIFLGLSNLLTDVINTITNRSSTFVAQIQFNDSIKKLNALLQKTEVSSEYIMQILEALNRGDIPTALTLMKQNNRKISFNISEVIDGIFGEIRENDGEFPRLVVSWQGEPMCASYEVAFEDIVESDAGKHKASLQPTIRRLWGDDATATAVPLVRYVNRTLYSNDPKDGGGPFMGAVNSALKEVTERKITPMEAILRYLPGGKNPRGLHMSPDNQRILRELYVKHGRFPTTMDILNELNISPKLFLETISNRKKTNQNQSENIHNKQNIAEKKSYNEDSKWKRKIIEDEYALIGARIFAHTVGGRGAEAGVKEIPVGAIANLVTYLTTEEILQRFNKEKVLEVLNAAVGTQNHEYMKLCKYLSYLTLSLRIRFDNDDNEQIAAIPFLIIDALDLDITDARAVLLVNIIQGMNEGYNHGINDLARKQVEQIGIHKFSQNPETAMTNPVEMKLKEKEKGQIFRAAAESVRGSVDMANRNLTQTKNNLWSCINLMQEVNSKGVLTIEVDTKLAKQHRQHQLQQHQKTRRDAKGARRGAAAGSNNTPVATPASNSSSSVQVAVPLYGEESGETTFVGVPVGPQEAIPQTMLGRLKSAMTRGKGFKRKRKGGTKKKRTRRKRKKTKRKRKRRRKKTIKKRRKRGRKTRRK